MKRGYIGMIAAAVSLLTLLQTIFSGCSGNVKIADPEDGGTVDNSDKTASKTIVSQDLLSFVYNFNYYGREYASGHYNLTLKLENDKAVYSIKIEENAVPAEMSGTAGAEAMKALAGLIKDQDTAKLNGWYKVNSALGSDMLFSADYASGEKILIKAEGGATAAPDLDPVPYLRFFDELAQADGQGLYDYSFTDNSDYSAPKTIKSKRLSEFYCDFYNHTSRSGDGFENGFFWGHWYITFKRDYRVFANIDEHCGIKTDCGNFYIDISDKAADELGQLFKDMGLEKLNGYSVKDSNAFGETRFGAFYGDESIKIEAVGERAIPNELDFIRILTFLRDYCREAGYDVPPLEGKDAENG